MKRERVFHTIRSEKITGKLTLAVVSDLHNAPYGDVTADLAACDAILVPGDLVDRHSSNYRNAARFLEEAADLAPVFYAIGNHEWKCPMRESWMAEVLKSRTTLLDNKSVLFRCVRIGGVSSTRSKIPDVEFLDRFEHEDGFRLLMCHHPEMYRDYVHGRDIDFTVCGHAHGGQIQIAGHGLYSPGQGIFPRLTHGLHDGGKMIISRGMTNGTVPRIPRIGNPCELIILKLEPADCTEEKTKE